MKTTGNPCPLCVHERAATLGTRIRRTDRLDHYAVSVRDLHAGFFHKNGCVALSRERSALLSLSGFPASSASPGITH
jgi:hypothetical protein